MKIDGITIALVILCFIIAIAIYQWLSRTLVKKKKPLKYLTPLPTVKRRAMSVPYSTLKPSYPPIK